MRKECGKKSSYQGFKYHIEVYHAMESLFHALHVEIWNKDSTSNAQIKKPQGIKIININFASSD